VTGELPGGTKMADTQQDEEQAVELYQQARQLHLEGEVEKARALYKRALANHPRQSAVYNDLGVALRAMGYPRAAIGCYRRSLADEPEDADAWSNLGNAYLEIADNVSALHAFQQAHRLDPEEPIYLKMLGMAHFANRHFEKAETELKAALDLEPDDTETRLTLGITRLHLGRIQEGFQDYEIRLSLEPDTQSEHVAPVWQGDALKGRSLLVHAEQGLGDVLQFSRFLLPLQERADGPICGLVQKPLLRLFQASFPEIPFVAVGEPTHPHHVSVAFPSLPAKLGTGYDQIATRFPYLKAGQPSCVLPQTGQPKVGLTWSGNREKLDRSCPFPNFVRLTEVAGVDFYSFQRGAPQGDIEEHGAEALIVDLAGDLEDFADDAELVQQLDLVITIDTSFCHLAGGLDVPCWTLLTPRADWRFMTDQLETPWYPGMRLFRFDGNDSWSSFISRVRDALSAWTEQWQEVCKPAEEDAIVRELSERTHFP